MEKVHCNVNKNNIKIHVAFHHKKLRNLHWIVKFNKSKPCTITSKCTINQSQIDSELRYTRYLSTIIISYKYKEKEHFLPNL